jgi:hypothetical protein
MNTSQFDALARRQKVIWTQQPWSCICSNLTAGDAILLSLRWRSGCVAIFHYETT